jgi:hypothetical protein
MTTAFILFFSYFNLPSSGIWREFTKDGVESTNSYADINGYVRSPDSYFLVRPLLDVEKLNPKDTEYELVDGNFKFYSWLQRYLCFDCLLFVLISEKSHV